jgi:hypothetical protein
MIYLASPYSHPDPGERQRRHDLALAAAAGLTAGGVAVFSPIVNSHQMVLHHNESIEWHAWSEIDEQFIRCSSSLSVLTIPGWRHSRGIAAEIEIAKSLGLPVSYWMEPKRADISIRYYYLAGRRMAAMIRAARNDPLRNRSRP